MNHEWSQLSGAQQYVLLAEVGFSPTRFGLMAPGHITQSTRNVLRRRGYMDEKGPTSKGRALAMTFLAEQPLCCPHMPKHSLRLQLSGGEMVLEIPATLNEADCDTVRQALDLFLRS